MELMKTKYTKNRIHWKTIPMMCSFRAGNCRATAGASTLLNEGGCR